MADIRQQQGSPNGREGGVDGGESRGGVGGELAERITEHLEHIAEVALAQHKRSRSFTTMRTASVLGAGVVLQNLHLPEESAIASAYIENNSAATLTVYEGPGAGGRVVGIVRPTHYKRIALADHISSISIVANQADTTGALVIVTLSTHIWSPVDTNLS